MGIAGGVEQLQWLFSGTFVVMLLAVPLFGWLTSRYPRRKFLVYVYYFFITNLLLFFALFRAGIEQAWLARAFFIWASVFNLFVVSVFWSFMTDIFNDEQAKRLFGFIAAGGTTGALVGPVLTVSLVQFVGTTNLLLLSATFLGCAVLCIRQLICWQDHNSLLPSSIPAMAQGGTPSSSRDAVLQGGLFGGIKLVLGSHYLLGICLLMVLFTSLATFLYFQQAYIIRDNFVDPADRTAVFATMDFAVNFLTILIQVFLTGRIVNRLGMAWTLAIIPVLLCLGFTLLALSPALAVIVVVQVIRRAGNYAVMRPAREMLYVVLNREQKYKAKNFIDTVVYRGGDAVSAWLYAGLNSIGLGLAAIAALAVPISAIWAWVCFRLGMRQEALARELREKHG
jgi:AAA family ATP:ADP antiporter